MHQGKNGTSPWDVLAGELSALSRQTNHNWIEEKTALEEKLAKAQQLLEKQENKESKKRE